MRPGKRRGPESSGQRRDNGPLGNFHYPLRAIEQHPFLTEEMFPE